MNTTDNTPQALANPKPDVPMSTAAVDCTAPPEMRIELPVPIVHALEVEVPSAGEGPFMLSSKGIDVATGLGPYVDPPHLGTRGPDTVSREFGDPNHMSYHDPKRQRDQS